MHTQFFPQDHLEHVRLLMPVTGVVHVGVGAGRSLSYAAVWAVPVAVFVEAEESLHEPLARIVEGRPGWTIHSALVYDREGETDFCVADNPNESGLIPPERLTKLWKNLKIRERRRMNATTLASLLGASQHPSQSINWVVIECLPALPILRGSGPYFEHWDVILARVVLEDSLLPSMAATKSELDVFLSTHGFRCIACQEERQPAIGSALYVRDYKSMLRPRIAELQHSCDSQAKLAEERQQQIDQLTKERDSQAKVASDRQAQIEQLTKARDGQAKLAEELRQQIDQIARERDAQARLVDQRDIQLADLTRAHDEHARVSRERLGEIEKLLLEKEQLAERIAQMENDGTELKYRQRLLDEELIKAEAQIDLIKDLLLREKAL